jgi:SAM-dependent methyltransferase
MTDTYEDFAERYDLFFDTFGEHTDETVAFFRRLFRDNGVKSVLDCACGTAHDLVMFQRLGLETFGSDISQAMLARAEEHLDRLGMDIPLKLADYRDLSQHYPRTFDAVVCLSSSILEMATETEILRAFTSMRQVLSDGGVLVLSQGTTDKQWNRKPRFILAVNRPDFSRLFVIDYEERGAKYNVLDVFRGKGEYGLKVWTGHYLSTFLRDDYEKLLAEAGFRHTEFYGSYAFAPYDKTSSDRLITVAHK